MIQGSGRADTVPDSPLQISQYDYLIRWLCVCPCLILKSAESETSLYGEDVESSRQAAAALQRYHRWTWFGDVVLDALFVFHLVALAWVGVIMVRRELHPAAVFLATLRQVRSLSLAHAPVGPHCRRKQRKLPRPQHVSAPPPVTPRLRPYAPPTCGVTITPCPLLQTVFNLVAWVPKIFLLAFAPCYPLHRARW